MIDFENDKSDVNYFKITLKHICMLCYKEI